jgi:hypothetical protein
LRPRIGLKAMKSLGVGDESATEWDYIWWGRCSSTVVNILVAVMVCFIDPILPIIEPNPEDSVGERSCSTSSNGEPLSAHRRLQR